MLEEDSDWMKKAVQIARKGMLEQKELPIAALLVSNNQLMYQSTTLNYIRNGVIEHGEMEVLRQSHKEIGKMKHPITIYTTLEPCIMCIGAAIECGVDRIVYAMKAPMDGGECYVQGMQGKKEKIPELVGGVLEKEAINLMREFIETADKNHPSRYYAESCIV